MISKNNYRSNCPISRSLDVLGDKWTMIIIRDMLIFNKKTFKDFTESNEKIASNILSNRLKTLLEQSIITKQKDPKNKKTNIYRLTDIGLDMAPIILELTIWSIKNIENSNMNQINIKMLENKPLAIKTMQNNYKKGVPFGHS